MKKKIKHDKYLDELIDTVKGDYDLILKNIPLYSKKRKQRQLAEIDILAMKGSDCYVFEVKCSYRIKKATKQLLKIKKLLPNVRGMFFFCGESGDLELVM